MLYLGHFSFDAKEKDAKQTHGYFTCIAKAASADEAVTKLRQSVHKMRQTEKMLNGTVDIYLDDLIELATIPDEPVVTRYQVSEGAHPTYIDSSLPVGEAKSCQAYRWKDNKGEQMEPFVRYDY